MSTVPYYQPVPAPPPDWQQAWALRLGTMVNVLLQKANCAADLTLAPNAASTTMTDPRLSAVSVLTFMPTTANAATAKGTIYVTGQNKGAAVINHANNAQVDKTFRVGILG